MKKSNTYSIQQISLIIYYLHKYQFNNYDSSKRVSYTLFLLQSFWKRFFGRTKPLFNELPICGIGGPYYKDTGIDGLELLDEEEVKLRYDILIDKLREDILEYIIDLSKYVSDRDLVHLFLNGTVAPRLIWYKYGGSGLIGWNKNIPLQELYDWVNSIPMKEE